MDKNKANLINEHADIINKIGLLHNEITASKRNSYSHDDVIEYANKCIQLSAMKKYADALECRLENAGVVFDNGEYFCKVAELNPRVATYGSDYDVDTENFKCDTEGNK